MKQERNSSFELLRLLCIFGITIMHSFAAAGSGSSLLNTEVHVLYNSIFNTGVTCFILISGYFGIRSGLSKLIRIDLMVIFFTLFGTVLLGDFGIKELVKACVPVLTRRYWFISCYFALCILAPVLNQIAEHLKQSSFRMLLLILLLLFSFIPTVTTYDIMQDSGKGLVDFVMIYLIGRYLACYKTEHFCRKNLAIGIVSTILVIFILDSIRTNYHGVLYNTYSRDCSTLIILASVLIFLLFREMHFQSRAINRIASNVLAVTVLDSVLIAFFTRYIPLDGYADHPLLFLIVPAFALLIVLSCVLLNELRKATIGRIEPWLSESLSNLWFRIQDFLLNLMQRILSLFIRPES